MSKIKYILLFVLSFLCMNKIYADDFVHTEELPIDMDYDKHMGITAFQQKEYTKAVYYLEQYFRRQPSDEVGADYLYGAYLQLNRTNQAKAIFPYLSAENQTFYIVRPKAIASAYVEGGVLGSHCVKESDTSFIYPEYKNSGYGLLQLEHNITPQISYKHHFSLCATKGIQRAYSKDAWEDFNIDERQLAYSGRIELNRPSGWVFALCGTYVNDQYNTIEEKKEEKKEEPQNQAVNNNYTYGGFWYNNFHNMYHYYPYYSFYPYYFYQNPYSNIVVSANELVGTSVTLHSYAIGASAKKSFDWILPELHCSYANVMKNSIWQPKLKFTVFPFRNLNVYATTTLADVIYFDTNNFIIEEVVGGKILDWLWVELAYANGNMKFYSENDYSTFYTLLNKSKHRAAAKLLFPITQNISIMLLYRFMTKETEYIIVNKDEEHIYSQKFNSHNVIGGIKCSF